MEVNELKEGIEELKIRNDAAQLREAENEDCEIAVSQLLIHSLRLQQQLEAKCGDSE